MSPRVSQEYKEAVRDRFLDAAEKLFQQKGYYETSVDDVVQASGTSKGAIYGYFKSKEALFEELQERQYARNLEQARALLSDRDSTASKLEKIADIFFASQEHSIRQRSRMNLEFSATSLRMKPIHDKIENRYSQMQDLLTFLLKEGIRKGEFRKDIDIDSIASLLMAAVDGLSLRLAITDADYDWKKIKDALINLCLEGISATSHAQKQGIQHVH
jgi:AcrR family transcriptional regulator